MVFVSRFHSLRCHGYDVLFVLGLHFFVIAGGDVRAILATGLLKMLNELLGVSCDLLSDFNWVGSRSGTGVAFPTHRVTQVGEGSETESSDSYIQGRLYQKSQRRKKNY